MTLSTHLKSLAVGAAALTMALGVGASAAKADDATGGQICVSMVRSDLEIKAASLAAMEGAAANLTALQTDTGNLAAMEVNSASLASMEIDSANLQGLEIATCNSAN